MPPQKPIDEEQAFIDWATDFNQDYKKVAEAYGISVQTAYSWGRKYNWKERRREKIDTLVKPVFDEAMAELRLTWGAATHRLRTIISAGNDVDAIAAIKLLAQLTITTDTSTDTQRPLTLVDARQVHLHKELDGPDTKRAVASILASNIGLADEERKTTPRKTWG